MVLVSINTSLLWMLSTSAREPSEAATAAGNSDDLISSFSLQDKHSHELFLPNPGVPVCSGVQTPFPYTIFMQQKHQVRNEQF